MSTRRKRFSLSSIPMPDIFNFVIPDIRTNRNPFLTRKYHRILKPKPMNLLTGNVSPNGRRFLIAAGIILAVTGLAKLFTVTGDTTLLRVSDPIFGVEFRYLMFAAGVLELVVAGFCLLSKWKTISLVMVAWTASVILVYRIGIFMVDWNRPCGCLGNLTDVLKISERTAEWISLGLLSFLLIGSYGVMFSIGQCMKVSFRTIRNAG